MLSNLFLSLRAGLGRLAFWRRQVTPEAEPSPPVEIVAQVAATQPDPEPTADIPTTVVKSGLLARITQTLRFKHSAEQPPAPESSSETDAPSTENSNASEQTAKLSLGARITQTLRFLKRSDTPQEHAESAEEGSPSSVGTAKLSLTMRITNLFRQQPDTAEASDAANDSEISATIKTTATKKADEPLETEALAPARPNRIKMLVAWMLQKRVLIPVSSAFVLLISAGIGFSLMQSAQEKVKLQAELDATKQELEKQKKAKPLLSIAPNIAPTQLSQAAEKAPVPEAQKPTVAEEKASDPAFDIIEKKSPTMASSNTADGDCVITDKESVATNLKRCIEGFNAASSR